MAKKPTGLLYVSALIAAKDDAVNCIVKDNLTEEDFLASEREVFVFVRDFTLKHGKSPRLSTVHNRFPGVRLPKPIEPSSHYAEKVVERYKYRTVTQAMEKAADSLQLGDENFDPDVAIEHLRAETAKLLVREYHTDLLDFRDAHDPLFALYKEMLVGTAGKRLFTGWPTLDNMSMGLTEDDMLAIVGRPSQGKALPLDAPVLTMDGYRPMGEIKVGDMLASTDGKPSEVVGVYPQGNRMTVFLEFSDGREVECDLEHLWKVNHKGWKKPRVLDTITIIEMNSTPHFNGRLKVELFSGEYGHRWTYRLDPWALGILLGDGGLTKGVRFTTPDPEIVERMTACFPDLDVRYLGRYDYAIVRKPGGSNWLIKELKRLGMYGKLSIQKSIPHSVFIADRQSRVLVLQGLIDSDGWVSADGSVYFGSSSERLAEDTVQLVRSIGGIASFYPSGNDSWRVGIRVTRPREIVWLPKKRVRCKRRPSHSGRERKLGIFITGHREGRFVPCQCIAVNHKSRLFVADDFVVTHNTYSLLYMMYNMWKLNTQPVLMLSMEMEPSALAQRLAAMHTSFSVTKLKAAEMSTAKKRSVFHELKELSKFPVPMWIVDGRMASSVDDLQTLCYQLRPRAVFVDGAYLMSTGGRWQSKWDRIGEVPEALKRDIAKGMRIRVIASYQLGRDYAKKKKTQAIVEPGLEDIYGTETVGQVASLVIGLLQSQNIENERRKEVSILKGREGERGRFEINWDFNSMNFDEIDTSKEDDTDLMFT